MKRIVAVLLCLIAACLTAPAFAHSTSTSYLLVDARGERPLLRWDLAVHDVVWTVFIDRDFDGVVTWQEVRAAEATLRSAVLSQIAVKRGGVDCALSFTDTALARRAEQNYLSVALRADCPAAGALQLGGTLFMTGDASQRVLLSVTRADEQLTGVLGGDARVWNEPERASAWLSFARFVVEGIWHVLIGYDHIAFVLLLLLPAVLRAVNGKWQGATAMGQVAREVFTVVTAFTVAHSITLALAVTGTVKLPIQPIEVAIAASIALAGALNLLPRLSRLRLPLAFGFGFVHGFGFANALNEIDASGASLLPLLAGFNVGVEIAQLGIVMLVLPLIYLARGTRWYAAGVMPLGSCLLGGAGLFWLIQRL